MARRITANNQGGFTIHFSGNSPAHSRTAGMHTHRGSRHLTDTEAAEYRAFQQRYADYYARRDARASTGASFDYYDKHTRENETNREIAAEEALWRAALPESYDRSL